MLPAPTAAKPRAKKRPPPEPSPLEAPPKKAALGGGRRGEKVVVVPSVSYRATWDWDDLCEMGEKIEKKKLSINDFKKKTAAGDPLHKVPYGTMLDYIKDDKARHHGTPSPGRSRTGSRPSGPPPWDPPTWDPPTGPSHGTLPWDPCRALPRDPPMGPSHVTLGGLQKGGPLR